MATISDAIGRRYSQVNNGTAYVDLHRAFPSSKTRYRLTPESIDTSEILSMDLWKPVMNFRQRTYTTPDTTVIELRNCVWCAANGVVMTSGGEIVRESLGPRSSNKSPMRAHHPFDHAAAAVRRTVRLDGYTTSFRSYTRNYYHTLIDNVPRLYLLHQKPFSEIDRIRLLAPTNMSDVEWQLVDWLRPKNTTIQVVEPGQHYSLENFFFLSFLSQLGCGYLHSEYLKLFWERVLPRRPPSFSNRIFISRREAANGRRLTNYDSVAELLRTHGFTEIRAEDLTLQQQIELFYDAEIVVGAHGAGLSNLMFSPPGSVVIELFPTSFVVPHYYYLSKAIGCRYLYWCGTERHRHSDFRMPVEDLARLLSEATVLSTHHGSGSSAAYLLP